MDNSGRYIFPRLVRVVVLFRLIGQLFRIIVGATTVMVMVRAYD